MVVLPVHNTKILYTIQPSKIIALGLNYLDHVKESVSAQFTQVQPEVPTEPVLFAKTPNVLIGPGDPIMVPAILSRYRFEPPRIDYEAELAFIVKNKCRNIPPPRPTTISTGSPA